MAEPREPLEARERFARDFRAIRADIVGSPSEDRRDLREDAPAHVEEDWVGEYVASLDVPRCPLGTYSLL